MNTKTIISKIIERRDYILSLSGDDRTQEFFIELVMLRKMIASLLQKKG